MLIQEGGTVLKPAWTRFSHRLLSSDSRPSQIVEAGYALNAPSLQWKSLDFQFAESLLQRGAGTESLFRHGCNLHMPSSQSR
jgi:hypothetical protein